MECATAAAVQEQALIPVLEEALRCLVVPSTRMQKEITKRERSLEKIKSEIAIAMSGTAFFIVGISTQKLLIDIMFPI